MALILPVNFLGLSSGFYSLHELFGIGKLVVGFLRAVCLIRVVGLPIVIGLLVGLAFSFH